MIKFLVLIFLSTALGHLKISAKESAEGQVAIFEFQDLISQILALQNSYEDVEFRTNISILENGKELTLSPQHPLRLTLKNCFKQYLGFEDAPINFQKVWQDCEAQLLNLASLPKNWSIVIESLPFKNFSQQKIKNLELKNNFILPRHQGLLDTPSLLGPWDSQTILFNHSLPKNQHPYQYLGSNMMLSFNKHLIEKLEVRNIFKINKKIEALLQLEPPLSLELSALSKQNPMLTLSYHYTYADKKILPIKLSIYPGSLLLAGALTPVRNHQLILKHLQGGEQTEVGSIDEIEFDYVEQIIKTKGKGLPQKVDDLLLEALNMNAFLKPSI